MSHKVVARFSDGRMIKGTSVDVAPGKPTCHIHTEDAGTIPVALTELKALFFVKDLNGDSESDPSQAVGPADTRLRGTKRVDVRFHDGEEMPGLVNRYPPPRPFFFLLPANLGCNNIRILVNRAAVVSMSSPDFTG
jgi:hypothetical protein